MPNLGDYIGYLLSEIVNARVQADHETVRLAELYASDPFLKHMPVPRFRLPTVTLNVPVAIKSIKKEKEGGYSKEEALSYMRKSFDPILESKIERVKIELSFEEVKKLKKVLDHTIEDLSQSLKAPVRITHVIDKLVSTVIKTLRELPREEKVIDASNIQELANELRAAMHVEFTNLLREPARLDVLVTTAELREAGSTDILARFNFTISEQAVEWTAIESDGEPKKHLLVPE